MKRKEGKIQGAEIDYIENKFPNLPTSQSLLISSDRSHWAVLPALAQRLVRRFVQVDLVAGTIGRAERELRNFLYLLDVDNVHQLLDANVNTIDLDRGRVGHAGLGEQL